MLGSFFIGDYIERPLEPLLWAGSAHTAAGQLNRPSPPAALARRSGIHRGPKGVHDACVIRRAAVGVTVVGALPDVLHRAGSEAPRSLVRPVGSSCLPGSRSTWGVSLRDPA